MKLALLRTAALLLLSSLSSSGIVDFNGNGVSDLWERAHNAGNLFEASFDLAGDLDGDGWDNASEATAGTDPFDPVSPEGMLVPEIAIIPATFHDPDLDGIPDLLSPETATITWPTLQGKLYSLFVSPDLIAGTWIGLGDPYLGDGSPTALAIPLTQPDGSIPERLFWRVVIGDADSDSDLLTNFEEEALGTNPFSRYSDIDFLTDTFEVFNLGTDPTAVDTDNDGTLDHEEPLQAGTGVGEDPSTYAPEIQWIGYNRYLSYQYSENSASPPEGSGTLNRSSSWAPSGGGTSEVFQKIPFGGLHARLEAAIPFPVGTTPVMQPPFPIVSFGRIGDHYENAIHQEAQVRLMASSPPEEDIQRNLMMVTFTSGGGISEVDSYSFTIPAGKVVSTPQVFGTGAPSHEVYLHREFYSPRFSPPPGSLDEGWDDSGPELWGNVGVGAATSAGVGSTYSNAVSQRLEVAVADGDGQYLTLSDHSLPLAGNTFTINGVKETPASGARILLRLKSDTSRIFSTMRIHVFENHVIPVTIYRIYDSRVPQTEFSPGITNQQIIGSLNNAYPLQGNVSFSEHSTSNTYDLRYDQSVASKPELGLQFQNAKFPENSGYLIQSLTKKGEHGRPVPAKIIIHVVKEFTEASVLGSTAPKSDSFLIEHVLLGMMRIQKWQHTK